jgi:hypothetical protein
MSGVLFLALAFGAEVVTFSADYSLNLPQSGDGGGVLPGRF